MKRKVYRVAVTYGTWRGFQTYAEVPARSSAEILVKCAKKLGYHDAHIQEHEVEVYEKNVREDSRAGQEGGSSEERADRAPR